MLIMLYLPLCYQITYRTHLPLPLDPPLPRARQSSAGDSQAIVGGDSQFRMISVWLFVSGFAILSDTV